MQRQRSYLGDRRFQPAALALTLVSFSSGWNRVFTHTNGFYTAVGVAAILVAVAFTVAWLANKPEWMRWAFLASTALWIFIAGTSYTLIHSVQSSVIAVGWAILSAGSFWYETNDAEAPHER